MSQVIPFMLFMTSIVREICGGKSVVCN